MKPTPFTRATQHSFPSTFRKWQVNQLSRDFRKATALVDVPMHTIASSSSSESPSNNNTWAPVAKDPSSVVVRNRVVGINASDINFTAGTYKPGVVPPFDCGFEAIAEVVAVPHHVKRPLKYRHDATSPHSAATDGGAADVQLGDVVITQTYGAFAEYQVVSTRSIRKVGTATAPSSSEASSSPLSAARRFVPFLPVEISGTTASIAIDEVLRPQPGETALVTAAAGATGMFAAQLLKHHYRCSKVIGTCSDPKKAAFLKDVLRCCDVVVDYKKENLAEVLARETGGKGVNVVYESVGGEIFDAACANLSMRGRLVVIGAMSGYRDGSSFASSSSGSSSSSSLLSARHLGMQLLGKSASVHGFFLYHYTKQIPSHFDKVARLCGLVGAGGGGAPAGGSTPTGQMIVPVVDDQRVFSGIGSVPDAVDFLQSGANIGKVICYL